MTVSATWLIWISTSLILLLYLTKRRAAELDQTESAFPDYDDHPLYVGQHIICAHRSNSPFYSS